MELCVDTCGLLCRIADLEAALADSCDFALLKSIARCRPVPGHLRAKIWEVVIRLHAVIELQFFLILSGVLFVFFVK